MTVLIGEKVTIEEILESEGNQESETDKYNRVGVMARNSKGEFIIVEVQLSRERYYLERHTLWSVQSHHRQHAFGRSLRESAKGVFYQHHLLSHGQG